MNRFLLGAALAVLASVSAVPRASAESGRFDGLKALIEALPDPNPAADPDYMSLFGDNIPSQMEKCHWKTDEMDAIERILGVFAKNKVDLGYNTKGLVEGIGALPDFADRAKDKKAKSDYNDLMMGVHLAPDMTHASLVNADCRAMLRQHFDNGAPRSLLRDILYKSRFQLDAAKAPR